MPRIEIADFRISQRVADKMWAHGVSVDQLYDVIENRYVVNRNRAQRAALYVLIGRDHQGRCIAIPIAPTDDPFVWRPITAWYCKPAESARLSLGKSIMEESIHYGSAQEPLDDEERALMDADSWDREPSVEGVTIGSPGAILEIRFTREEIARLGPIARAQGQTMHEFVRQAALSQTKEHVAR